MSYPDKTEISSSSRSKISCSSQITSKLSVLSGFSGNSRSSFYQRKSKFDPIVWILFFPDIQLSARSLSDKFLLKSISGGIQILFCSVFYFANIRSKRMFRLNFKNPDKSRKQEIRDLAVERLHEILNETSSCKNLEIPDWYIKKLSFSHYSAETSKWSRKCQEHYLFLLEYISILLQEYQYRFRKQHPLNEIFYIIYDSNIVSRFPRLIKTSNNNEKNIQLYWKTIEKQYLKNDILESFRDFYKSKIYSLDDYFGRNVVNREIPEFLYDKFFINKNQFLE